MAKLIDPRSGQTVENIVNGYLFRGDHGTNSVPGHWHDGVSKAADTVVELQNDMTERSARWPLGNQSDNGVIDVVERTQAFYAPRGTAKPAFCAMTLLFDFSLR